MNVEVLSLGPNIRSLFYHSHYFRQFFHIFEPQFPHLQYVANTTQIIYLSELSKIMNRKGSNTMEALSSCYSFCDFLSQWYLKLSSIFVLALTWLFNQPWHILLKICIPRLDSYLGVQEIRVLFFISEYLALSTVSDMLYNQ